MTGGGEREAVVAALRQAKLPADIASTRDLSGGCIHRVLHVTLADGDQYAAKVNRATALTMFEEEAAGLSALAKTRTVMVPKPVATLTHADTAVLLMTFIAPLAARSGGGDSMWENFGADLAALHQTKLQAQLARGYGFVADNHLGSTPQPNGWRDDWVTFYAEHRLGHQVRLARSRNLLDRDEGQRVDAVIARLDHLLPREPRPSLLHGDLWSGNALPTMNASGAVTCAVIDPACYVGDALADIAMMQLFGGFGQPCFDEWARQMDVDLDSEETVARLAIYQLYHVLNHVNLFGRGYAGQAMGLVRRLGG